MCVGELHLVFPPLYLTLQAPAPSFPSWALLPSPPFSLLLLLSPNQGKKIFPITGSKMLSAHKTTQKPSSPLPSSLPGRYPICKGILGGGEPRPQQYWAIRSGQHQFSQALLVQIPLQVTVLHWCCLVPLSQHLLARKVSSKSPLGYAGCI